MFFNCWLICIDKHCFCFPAGSQTAATFTVNRFNDSSVSVCLCVSFSSCLFHCFIFTLQNVLFQGIVFFVFFQCCRENLLFVYKTERQLGIQETLRHAAFHPSTRVALLVWIHGKYTSLGFFVLLNLQEMSSRRVMVLAYQSNSYGEVFLVQHFSFLVFFFLDWFCNWFLTTPAAPCGVYTLLL